MFKPDPLADTAGAILFEKTEQRLEALLAEHGASDRSELPVALQGRLLQSAIIETAAANFPMSLLGFASVLAGYGLPVAPFDLEATRIPAANLEMMKHGFRSFTHSAFLPAMDRMKVSCKSQGDAFEMTRGIHAAVSQPCARASP